MGAAKYRVVIVNIPISKRRFIGANNFIYSRVSFYLLTRVILFIDNSMTM